MPRWPSTRASCGHRRPLEGPGDGGRGNAAPASVVRLPVIGQLARLDVATWRRVPVFDGLVVLLIGIPSDIIPNPVFGRPVPVRTLDVLIWAVTSLLIGLVFAIRAPMTDSEQTRTVWMGFVSFLADGCPVCNQVVVAAVGVSGALSWWAPVQPVVGAVAIGAALWALRRRLATFDLQACPVEPVPA